MLYPSFQPIKPFTAAQARTEEAYNSPNVAFIIQNGFAGTGKTLLGMSLAFQSLVNKDINHVKLLRNAVASRKIGFLPGDEDEKDSVYLGNFATYTNRLFNRNDAFETLVSKGRLEAGCTTFKQGETWDNCTVVIDESQNMDFNELDMCVTRAGQNCRIIFCCDSW